MVQSVIGSSRRVDLEHTLVTTSYGKWFFGVYGFQILVVMIVFIKAIPLCFSWTCDIDLYHDVSIILGLFSVYYTYLWLTVTDFLQCMKT